MFYVPLQEFMNILETHPVKNIEYPAELLCGLPETGGVAGEHVLVKVHAVAVVVVEHREQPLGDILRLAVTGRHELLQADLARRELRGEHDEHVPHLLRLQASLPNNAVRNHLMYVAVTFLVRRSTMAGSSSTTRADVQLISPCLPTPELRRGGQIFS